LEVADLQNNRHQLNHERDAHDWQEQAPPRLKGKHGETGPERQRSSVTHEDLGRMDVVPEISQQRADDQRRERGRRDQTAGERQDQVASKRGERRSSREAIKAVDLIYAGGAAKDGERGEGDKVPSEVDRSS